MLQPVIVVLPRSDHDLSRTQPRVAVLRGMVGMVTPGLRAVFVRFGDSDVHVKFVYDHEPTEVDIEDVDDVETEMIADLHPEIIPHLTAEFDANSNLGMQVGEIIAFKRKEPTW